jgi:hypothetical protein
MGFYYGSSQAPPPEDKSGGFRETIAIIWAVFSVLAVPLGIIVGILAGVAAVIWLFTFNAIAGGVTMLAIIMALVSYGVWEAKHPPKFG